ncbi:aromatic amino acid transaminase [Maritimibacter dapengensis]|uniref:Aspartate/tyrosine/aromatic aminotransferase n=1 Tax=Maritimibacter dapengensis TaxID=2836868 RepID=A0ABS6T575_9RHOB|nr:amino acid aminotransferase [Maritimibacter dapengensis]MBV7380407.1 aspartate/tyrosine/aromatic aminotransferase [Maritimibacter dapengensis]
MFELLNAQPQDKIMALMVAYREDPRETKVDLGVGVYKDPTGNTPVMRAVKSAEKQLWEAETTKSYTALGGDPAFVKALSSLVLGDAVSADTLSGAAQPGGTGAIHQALELVKMANPDATIWLSAPTWPNHPSIIKHLKMNMAEYRYFDNDSRAVDFSGMMADLDGVKAGDVVLLHGCCHNPTGANLTIEQWKEVADLIGKKNAVPLIDIAYQGFGDGLEADAQGTRIIASTLPETLIAASCSKNFGVYRERTGLLMAVSQDTGKQKVTQGNLTHLNRQNFSFPPDHGARVVQMILDDPKLRSEWETELEEVRTGMLGLRKQLADALRQRTNSDNFDFIAEHRGMFSRLGATPEQVEHMREKHGIYMVGDSRMNIAGLNKDSVDTLADAIVDARV